MKRFISRNTIIWINGAIDKTATIYDMSGLSSNTKEYVLKRKPNLPKVNSVTFQKTGGRYYECKILEYYSRNYKGDKLRIVALEDFSTNPPEYLPEDNIDLKKELLS